MTTSSLHRTPSVKLIDRLCNAIETPTATTEAKATQTLDRFFAGKSETEALSRGQRLVDLTLGLQAPHDAHRAEIAHKLTPALQHASPKFDLALQLIERNDVTKLLGNTVASMLKIMPEMLDIEYTPDVEAARQACDAAIAARVFGMRMALAYARTLSGPCMEAMLRDFYHESTQFNERLANFMQQFPEMISSILETMDDNSPMPTLDNPEQVERVVAFLNKFCNVDFSDQMKKLEAEPSDSAEIVRIKSFMRVKTLNALGGLYDGASLDKMTAFYASPAGQEYQAHRGDIDKLSNNILEGLVNEVLAPFKAEIEKAADEAKQRQQDFFTGLFDALAAQVAEHLPEDPQERAAFLQAFKEGLEAGMKPDDDGPGSDNEAVDSDDDVDPATLDEIFGPKK